MRDLYRCLDEYTPELLRGLATAWGVELAKGEPREYVRQLAEAMLAPTALEAAIATLSAEARAAFSEIRAAGGVLPAHRLAVRYGQIRRLGPAGLGREQPWAQPAGPLEELYYRGLIYRAFGTVEGHHAETLLLPRQFAESLGPAAAGHAPALAPLAAPPAPQAAGSALMEDLLALLVAVRRQPLRLSAGEPAAVPEPGALGLPSGRWLGGDDAERRALAWRLAWSLRLVRRVRDTVLVGVRTRDWLRLPDGRRQRSLYLAWREDARYEELRHLPTLLCEDTGWQSDPVGARRRLSGVLGRCPAETWFSLEAFIAELQRLQPDYLRPDGDYESWFIRDAASGEYLRGFGAWAAVEGTLARYLITGPLHWLGLVDLAAAAEPAACAFRLTARGASLLDPAARGAPATRRVPAVVAEIADDFTVRLPVAETIYQRYQLERFAEWQGQDDETAVYRITADAVWLSQDAGIKIEQILGFLRRIGGEAASPVVLRTLQAWGGRFGRVFVRRRLVLQVADEATMQQLLHHAEIRPLLGEILGPTACLVEEAHVESLTSLLKGLGIWPHIRL
jgi:hypothetical protein